jgi:hypothetical protein
VNFRFTLNTGRIVALPRIVETGDNAVSVDGEQKKMTAALARRLLSAG